MENRWTSVKKGETIYYVATLGDIIASAVNSSISQKYGYTLSPIQVGNGKPKNLGVEYDFFICGKDDEETKNRIKKLKIEIDNLLLQIQGRKIR